MRLIAAFGVALAATAAMPALAADLDCQVGVMAGSVFGRSQHVPDGSAPLSDHFNVNGRGVGAQAGCLAARDRVRYGFFGDLMDTNAQGNTQALPPNQQDGFVHTAFDWLGTLRAVGGYDLGSGFTAYLTGGAAAASVQMRLCKGASCAPSSQTMWGLAVGGGMQYRLLRRLSTSVEYLYFHFEDKPFPRSGIAVVGDRDVAVNPDAHVLRVALHFHF
jgi:opacity protein-like surface antigen